MTTHPIYADLLAEVTDELERNEPGRHDYKTRPVQIYR
jgi:hypothetical protein